MFRKVHIYVVSKTDGKGIPYKRQWFLASIFFFGVFIYGSLGAIPLKWNQAFEFNNSFQSFLALNPLQNFFYTLKLRRSTYDETKVREYFPLMKQWMGLTHEDFSFKREVKVGANTIQSQPNIVLVVCESFSMYKSSMSGNPLNTTPFFQSMADKGILFNRCFTPHFSTARGLFATLTGTPDVQLSKFSTRNPQALDQHTIINDFKGYEKFYFLGGDPDFNNFEGLVKNIDGLQMNTERNFQLKPVNVWGISDKDLFLQANKVFSSKTNLFSPSFKLLIIIGRSQFLRRIPMILKEKSSQKNNCLTMGLNRSKNIMHFVTLTIRCENLWRRRKKKNILTIPYLFL